jgi:hypothetical protein
MPKPIYCQALGIHSIERTVGIIVLLHGFQGIINPRKGNTENLGYKNRVHTLSQIILDFQRNFTHLRHLLSTFILRENVPGRRAGDSFLPAQHRSQYGGPSTDQPWDRNTESCRCYKRTDPRGPYVDHSPSEHPQYDPKLESP